MHAGIVSKFEADFKIFKIINIVEFVANYFLFSQQIKDVQYRPHYSSYEIDPNVCGKFVVLNFNDLVGPSINLIKTAKGKNMVRIKEYYMP